MRTREQIEQSVQEPKKAAKRTPHPNSLKNLVAPWKPGQTGNPEGKNGRDMAQLICRAAFENNPELIYKAVVNLLGKGSAFGLQVAADRAYGKLTEKIEHGGEVHVVERLMAARKRLQDAGRD